MTGLSVFGRLLTDVYAPLLDLFPPLFKFGPIWGQISTNALFLINYTTRAPFVDFWGRLDNHSRVISLAAVKILTKDQKNDPPRREKVARPPRRVNRTAGCLLVAVIRGLFTALTTPPFCVNATRMRGGGALAADQRPGDFSRVGLRAL